MTIERSGSWFARRPGIGRGQAGVTLTELVIVVSIIVIFAASSLPWLGSIVPELKSRGVAEQVVEALRTARQNAIGTTAVYRVIFGTTTIEIKCTDGTPAGNVCPTNRPPDTLETVSEAGWMGDSATLAATPGEMRFDPKGAALTGSGNVIVSYPSGPSWRVEVNPPGRVRACEGTTPCP
jgi:prepilin-type N-terminal cleavage/methylation domain-containing protein